MKLYTIGEAAAILDVDEKDVRQYADAEGVLIESVQAQECYVASTDLEKIREAMRYRPL